jgi:hypothetical protein
MTIVLREMTREAADAILAGERPGDVRVADTYLRSSPRAWRRRRRRGRFGPFFLHRSKDDVVVGEIGGASSTRTGRSRSATPLSSRSGTVDTRPPKSGRVLEKAGFAMVREVEDADEAGNVVLVTD